MHPKPMCGFCSHSHFDQATVMSCVYNEKGFEFSKWREYFIMMALALLRFLTSGIFFLGIMQDIIIFVCTKDPGVKEVFIVL